MCAPGAADSRPAAVATHGGGSVAGGDGDAIRIEAGADLSDLGMTQEGSIATYFESRTAGFSTLDYDVTDDETLWGVAVAMQATERLEFEVYYDDYTSNSGEHDRAVTEESLLGAVAECTADTLQRTPNVVQRRPVSGHGGDEELLRGRQPLALGLKSVPPNYPPKQ